MKKIVESTNAPAPIGPYSQAVISNNMLFISGQICLNAQSGELVNSDIKTETKQVMENIGEILKAANANYSNIIKSSIFLKNMDDFAQVNEEYGSFFTESFPARETVEVSRLPKDVNVEISIIAAL